MKKALMTIVLVLIGIIAFAQERIAVFPFEDLNNVLTQEESIFFYRQFSNEFTNRSSGRFIPVPRVDVEKLFKIEETFQLSRLSSRAKTAEVESVLNGTQILTGVIGRWDNSIAITISLYTFPDFIQLPGGVDIRVTNKTELLDKIPELVRNMQNEIVKNQPPAPPYKIGDRGPGGGFIFFAENGVFMECSMDLGSFDWNTAIREARNYRGGGFSDWRLPTRGELELIFKNLKLKGLGGFSEREYWSSEPNGNPPSGPRAWSVGFGTSRTYSNSGHAVTIPAIARAIRQF
jgi:hypothetical protein